ncbi:MAG TPA: DoxX family protein [Bryobacteraceae bacterium]|jgi:hypothetical protein
MNETITAVPGSKGMLWTGRVLSAIPILLLLLSAVMKFAKPPAVLQGFAHYGYAEGLIVTIGALELICTILYAIPRTAVLGAILVTAYLGGATATNVRVGDLSWITTVILGVLAWAGLYARDSRVRSLLPLRN